MNMCPAIPVVGIDLWRADVHKSASLALRLSAAVQNHAWVMALAADVWCLDFALRKVIEQVYVDYEHRIESGIPAEPVSDEAIAEALASTRALCNTIDRVYEKARAGGLTNRRMVGAAFNSIRLRSDELRELVEAAELSMNPEVDKMFDRTREEFERGEVFDLTAIK